MLPNQAQLTPEAKESLRKTIRRLRDVLLSQLTEEAEREYRLGVPLEKAKLAEAQAQKRQRLEAWLSEQARVAVSANAGGPRAAVSNSVSSDSASSSNTATAANNTGAKSGKKGKTKTPAVGNAPAAKLSDKQRDALRQRHLQQAVKEAAHTLLNRLVIVRILEQAGLSKPLVLTGGWKSAGYTEFREFAPALCNDAGQNMPTSDDTKGYAKLLQLVFDELALELPGVFGNVGLTSLFPIPAATLREVVEALNAPELQSAWSDDTTLGWVYQFWNDPEREGLDDKINSGGKIEPHEIAAKTQMFTERYMVEWLLQNSLGQLWLALCQKNGWTPDFEHVRQTLEDRRVAFRQQREAGEVPADALMPINSPLEDQWKYWAPQPLPDDAVNTAPPRLQEVKLLDPACGSGHFLVIAFDLLAALYLEQTRHLKQSSPTQAATDEPTPAQIATWIVEHNLHGIDIDPRAIQIAAAAVWLKAKRFAPEVRLGRLNLVAPCFHLAALPADDPALLRLQAELSSEVGIPPALTQQLVAALSGVDHLGTLLRVDEHITEALNKYEQTTRGTSEQGDLFLGKAQPLLKLPLDQARTSVLDKLGLFLNAHESESDLGLRLEGEQLAAGVRFVQLVQPDTYDVVVGNPPYQGTSKMAEATWFAKHYPRGKADLYACFLERALELTKPGGVSALLTMRGWMFLSQYTALREGLLKEYDLRAIGDLDRGAFDDVPNEVLAVAVCILRRAAPSAVSSIATQPTPPSDKSYDRQRTGRKRAALLAQVGRFTFDVAKLSGIEGTPLVYWWDEPFLDGYLATPKLREVYPIRVGLQTGDNVRFLRKPHEVSRAETVLVSGESSCRNASKCGVWRPYVKGAAGRAWFEPLSEAISWLHYGAAYFWHPSARFGQGDEYYFKSGVAFSTIGSSFSARAHVYPSIFADTGASVFALDQAQPLCLLNSQRSQYVAQSLNPGVHFTSGDVARIPVYRIDEAHNIFAEVRKAFLAHERSREPSVEFKRPGPSPWRYAQAWAQQAVDRAKGEPLLPYTPEYDAPEPVSFISFAVGVALGRFGQNDEGILDLTLPQSEHTSSSKTDPKSQPTATTSTNGAPPIDVSPFTPPDITPSPQPKNQILVPGGILFISAAPNVVDSFAHPASVAATRIITAAWREHSAALLAASGSRTSELNEWLRKDFFAYHKSLYESRPIYFPLSSANKNFVAWVSIHQFADNTLQTLLATYLHPAREKLEGEINDLNATRTTADKKQKAQAERQFAQSQRLLEELHAFIRDVTLCAEKGAPPTEPKCPPREADAPFHMDLDDGVMINSAALWPLLEPQWRDPKKWWKELCTADGRKDYDWAHLAARYFPTRVDAKCQTDPSLAVAHGCFWKYHPAKAYAWELRLQDEISPTFTIDEPSSDTYRATFLANHPTEAADILAKEHKRRERKASKADVEEPSGDEGTEALEAQGLHTEHEGDE